MMKDILQGVGIGCILAGGILYYTNTGNVSTASDAEQYKSQLDELKIELDKVKKELAVAQTLTSSKTEKSAGENSNASGEKAETKPVSGSPSKPITKIILTIEAGSTSSTVADKLERAGIIGSAGELEQYLIDNGLAGRIQIGVHEVDTTMDLGTIAGIITNTKKR
ncbi:endolytic transglycosylase MltG [Sporosarcina luteola]|uniref:endolytic transglycosylase MltG n=1 Tax=Sporosarcina luteola TaxID=582850 RepID=UPI0020416508|nr:endolytic transglycosylase MltG [Sporosarcina luteola]MCM3743357.1 endolytic transglycosylase MltG [Sporosarcina luteola]